MYRIFPAVHLFGHTVVTYEESAKCGVEWKSVSQVKGRLVVYFFFHGCEVLVKLLKSSISSTANADECPYLHMHSSMTLELAGPRAVRHGNSCGRIDRRRTEEILLGSCAIVSPFDK